MPRRAVEPDDADGDAWFTRLTNDSSKKVENLAAAVALHFMHYNFARPHQWPGKNTTPAMADGISDHVWTCEEVAELLD